MHFYTLGNSCPLMYTYGQVKQCHVTGQWSLVTEPDRGPMASAPELHGVDSFLYSTHGTYIPGIHAMFCFEQSR